VRPPTRLLPPAPSPPPHGPLVVEATPSLSNTGPSSPRPPSISIPRSSSRGTPSPESNSLKKNESDRGHVAWKSFRFKNGRPIVRLIASSSSRASPPPRCPASTMPFFFLHLRPVQPATRARGGAPTVSPPGKLLGPPTLPPPITQTQWCPLPPTQPSSGDTTPPPPVPLPPESF
jgi:hypothetical protein